MALCLGPYGHPRGGAVPYERGAPASLDIADFAVTRTRRRARVWRYNPVCKATPVILRGVVTPVILHGVDVEKPFDSSTRRVTYPESYITKYTTYTKIKSWKRQGCRWAPRASSPPTHARKSLSRLTNWLCEVLIHVSVLHDRLLGLLGDQIVSNDLNCFPALRIDFMRCAFIFALCKLNP